MLTLRKKRFPVGKIFRCCDDLSNIPSLYHKIVGFGEPSDLQFNVTGSFRGTTVSIGCSTIRGDEKARKERERERKKFN